jgi:signal transduction histidine kinase/CheY-like chemotaxis protein
MSESERSNLETRVLLLTPTAKDGAISQRILAAAGLSALVYTSLEDVCREIDLGAGAVVVTEEALLRDKSSQLVKVLQSQPQWSDLPVIVLTAAGPDLPRKVRALLGPRGVTLLKRPLEVAVFLNALRVALRDRERQYLVRDQLSALSRQADLLREADRRKDEFLAMLAHELRNPLAPIRNGLQIIQVAPNDQTTVMNVRSMMERQVQHLTRLVDDLLDVSRITRGRSELRKTRVDLAEIIARAVETTRPIVDARKHQLTIAQPNGPVYVIADPTRMIQVVGNLINNAAKYSDERGHITIALEQTADSAILRVQDEGMGIAPNMLPRVFDLFTQVERSLDRSQGGLGIGLTLVRGLVELHGGRIEAFSDGPGHGSEFVVHLPPATEEELLPYQTTDAKSAENRKCHRILVVDDNVDAAQSLATLLRLAGHEVRTVHNGVKALEIAPSFRPEAVFLDLGLPGIDGYEVASQLRSGPGGQDLLLFALTGYGQDEDRRRTREAGFDHHLTKPADPVALQLLLTRAGMES